MAEEKNPCSFRDKNSGRPADGLLRHSIFEYCVRSPAPIYLHIGTIFYCAARMAQWSSRWHQGNSDVLRAKELWNKGQAGLRRYLAHWYPARQKRWLLLYPWRQPNTRSAKQHRRWLLSSHPLQWCTQTKLYGPCNELYITNTKTKLYVIIKTV